MLWALLFIDLFSLVTSDRDQVGWHNDTVPCGTGNPFPVLGGRLN